MKNKLVLISLFILPIAIYLVFSTASHNSLFLPTISKNNKDIPVDWTSLDGSKESMKGKITVLGFVGDSVIENRGNFFNLNQKIYNKYKGFKDFQMIMVVPLGNEKKCQQIIDELAPITGDMKGWRFVFSTPDKIQEFYDSYKLIGQLDENKGTPAVIIVDKELNHRGRKGKNKKGEEEYKESYNTISAADLHNEMTDDVKIILREYRLALKKNKNERKDAFRDNIKENIEKENAMKERELIMEGHLKDAQLKYLQAQINPHFLFNTLNLIGSTAITCDAELATDLIEAISEILRYNLEYDERKVDLETEVDMLKKYIFIFQVLF